MSRYLSKILFEIIFIVCGYLVYKEIWEVQISSELLPCLPEPDNRKIIMPQQSFDFFEATDTASLAALVVAEGSTSNYGPSGF